MEDVDSPLIGPSQCQQTKSRRFPLTGFRVLTTVAVLAWFMVKAFQFKTNYPMSPTQVECMIVGIGFLGIIYLGRFENVDPPVWPRFYHQDYSYEILYLPLRVSWLALASFSVVTLVLCLPLFAFVLPLAVLTAKGMRHAALLVSCSAFMTLAFIFVRITTLFMSSRRRNQAVLVLKNGKPGLLASTAFIIGGALACYLYSTTLLHSSMTLIREIVDRCR